MNSKANRLSKLTALALALILLMSVFSGCKLPDNTVTQPVTIESGATEAPAAEATPSPEPTASPPKPTIRLMSMGCF